MLTYGLYMFNVFKVLILCLYFLMFFCFEGGMGEYQITFVKE